MKLMISKGTMKYGIIVIMLTLALLAYLKPEIDQLLFPKGVITIGVMGSTVVKYDESYLSTMHGKSLNQLIKKSGIKGYKKVTVSTRDDEEFIMTSKETDDVYLEVTKGGSIDAFIVKNGSSIKAISDLQEIQCK